MYIYICSGFTGGSLYEAQQDTTTAENSQVGEGLPDLVHMNPQPENSHANKMPRKEKVPERADEIEANAKETIDDAQAADNSKRMLQFETKIKGERYASSKPESLAGDLVDRNNTGDELLLIEGAVCVNKPSDEILLVEGATDVATTDDELLVIEGATHVNTTGGELLLPRGVGDINTSNEELNENTTEVNTPTFDTLLDIPCPIEGISVKKEDNSSDVPFGLNMTFPDIYSGKGEAHVLGVEALFEDTDEDMISYTYIHTDGPSHSHSNFPKHGCDLLCTHWE